VKAVVKVDFEGYFNRLIDLSADQFQYQAIVRAVKHYTDRKAKSLQTFKVEEWAEELKGIRRAALDKMDVYISQAIKAMKEQGMNVYLAKDGDEANRLILKMIGDEKEIVKVKSLTSEEIELNEFLEEHGIKAWETDVGAIVLQLLKWKPSHPTGVSITVPRQRAAEAYSKLAGRELPPEPRELVRFAKEFVRRKAMEARVGFSGANAIAADTGLIYILTNEANDRLVTTLPDKHIVLAGIEKVMPDRYTCELYAKVIPVYATGGATVTFMSTIGLSRSNDIERVLVTPASGPSEIDVILLDNGRSDMLVDPDFREAFTCIKCGGCLYTCPVWNVVGGYYGEHGPYMGGFGTPWTLFTRGLEATATQAFTCTLCGRCKDVCPMGIDIPRMVLKVREKLARKDIIPPQLKALMGNVLTYKSAYKPATA